MLSGGGGRSNSAHNVFLEYHKHRPSVMKGMETIDEVEKDHEQEFDMFHHVVSGAMNQDIQYENRRETLGSKSFSSHPMRTADENRRHLRH